MTTTRIHGRAAMFACAMGLILQMPPAIAGDQHQNRRHRHNRPIDVTFTKWVTTGTLLAGIAGGDIDGRFVGEVLEGQTTVNPEVNPTPEGLPGPTVNGVRRLEAAYAVIADDEDASFTALIRGGQDQVTGVARFAGFVAAGWRSGAQVRVVYQRYFAGDSHCLDAGAPVTATCFQGTIQIGPAPRR